MYSEPDFTNPNSSRVVNPESGECFSPSEPKWKPRESRGPALTPHPGYILADMNPTARDPQCASSTNLACFWPVYVGNFKAAAHAEVDNKVQLYFASRGLHVRWCIQQIDDYYAEFQRPAGLYDMLVYFVSERDAKLAIEWCHRDSFNGYTLNVFPGRYPVYFDPVRSVHAQNMKSGRIFSEHFFEKHVKRYDVEVDCVVKFDTKNGALEFAKSSDVIRAQTMERMWTYLPVTGQMQKQRFLEKDLMKEIETLLAGFPNALEPKQDDKYMKMLLQGQRPFVNPNVEHKVVPLRRGPPKHVQMKRFQQKQKKLAKAKEKRLAKTKKN